MTAPPAVALSGVSLAMGGRRVLSDVSFAVAQGEFVGVLGANGAGKTTLMRALLGLVRPASGEIRVLGRPAARGDGAVGYMPQNRDMAGLSARGRDVVGAAVGGSRWGLPVLGSAGRRELDRALDLVDARSLAMRRLADMSGGERQRLLLAQALLGRPRLLLLDEPLAGLDPRHQQDVVDLARRLQRELGVAVLFSAHELNPLLGALDRVAYLGGGRAVLGTVDGVITGPVLSRLYGSPIDVIRAEGRIFVMSGRAQAERNDCGACRA